MSAMERLKVWLNQQIAKILGDLQEREPVEDPSPTRAFCRIFFMVSLLLGFLLLLVYTFIDAPDARVVQMHHLTPGSKNHAFPSCFLYRDRNSPNCTKWSKAKFPLGTSVSCPCTNTSAPWKNFVKFYLLHGNPMDWVIDVTVTETFPYINATIHVGNETIVKDTGTLTAEKFCNLTYLLTIEVNSTISSVTPEVYGRLSGLNPLNPVMLQSCIWMASLLFPAPSVSTMSGTNKYYEDRTRSTQYLNTQSLLNRAELNTLLAQLARESVLSRRLVLDMALSLDVRDEDFRRFYNALAQLLTGLLDREETMDPRQSYMYGAQELCDTLNSNVFFDNRSVVPYLANDSGLMFLQPEIDWESYRQTCNPKYCEVIMPMGEARKLYWAFGILGGVATIALAFITTLLWPCTAMLLLWISNRNTAERGRPGTPQVALVAGPQTIELS